MDIAPYIKDGLTFVPVKYLAKAFCSLFGTMVIGGPTSSGGVLAGSCQVKTVATVIGTP